MSKVEIIPQEETSRYRGRICIGLKDCISIGIDGGNECSAAEHLGW